MARETGGVWDASQCALLLIDYQEHVLNSVFEQDRRVVELNARTLAKAARAFGIPVVLSTVGVEMGANGPTVKSLKAELPDLEEIDRPTMNAWEDEKFLAAVKATGRKRLIIGGVVTSVCVTYPAIDALAEGYEVGFVVDAAADTYLEAHDTAVLRLAHAGAVPFTAVALITEWFRDWKSPLADAARKLIVPYFDELAVLKKSPQLRGPSGIA